MINPRTYLSVYLTISVRHNHPEWLGVWKIKITWAGLQDAIFSLKVLSTYFTTGLPQMP